MSKEYRIKEAYYSLQGEGAQTGRAVVFCRFAGCNLWSGGEAARSKAICQFCDTDFVGTDGRGGGQFRRPQDLSRHLRRIWDNNATGGKPYVVFTGGEPTLQLDAQLISCCKEDGFEVGIETNGTEKVPEGLDWICVSPKAGAGIVQRNGHELKLVFPQPELLPVDVEGLEFDNFFLQPMDSNQIRENTTAAVEYCLQHPRWRLSLQTHKFTGIP